MPIREVAFITVALGLVITMTALPATAGIPGETAEQKAARMKWFNDARFGMFIHWGVYSVPAGEWNGKTGYGEWIMESAKIPVSTYEKFAERFNPVKYDPQAWAKLAHEAGMKYLVITSKHHDGFQLYPSKLSDWNVSRTPYKQDLLKPLAEACKAEGIRFCTYHSIMDWHHSAYEPRRAWNDVATGKPDMDAFQNYLQGQVKEIIDNYDPGILWFDGEWEGTWTPEHGAQLEKWVRQCSPNIIINNRVGKSRSGMAGIDDPNIERAGDYGTPEQEIPGTGLDPGYYWESCMTMNDHWGFNRANKNYKSSTTLIRNLIDCASKGGNYLLNVGPTPEGEIPPESVQRLKEIGVWMKVYGDAIYATSAGPFRKLAWGRCTRKGDTLNLFVFDWPKDGKLVVPGLANDVTGARLLADPRDVMLKTDRAGDDVVVDLPAGFAANPHAEVVALTIQGSPRVTLPRFKQDATGKLALLAEDADIHGQMILENRSGKFPNIGGWMNAKDWLSFPVTLDKAGEFDLVLTYACQEGSDGANFTVEMQHQSGGASCGTMVDSTGGWDKFKTVTIGRIGLSRAGDYEFAIKATSKPNDAVMNFAKLELVPVK